MSRRLLLHGAALTGAGIALAGCTTSEADDVSTPARPTASSQEQPDTSVGRTDPDVDRVEAAIASERALLVYCRDSVAEHPDIAATLRQVADQQQKHIAVLRGALTEAGPGRVEPAPVMRGDRAVLHTVRRMLVEAQRQRRSDALAADSGLLARLFASISASHAVAAGLDGLQA